MGIRAACSGSEVRVGARRPGTQGRSCSRVETPARLPDGEVHVVGIGLDGFNAATEVLAATLSEDERRRADRFLCEHARRTFIVARGMLRHLLAGYLGTEPGAVRFAYNEHGKPELAGDPAGECRNLHFNLSHAGSWILYAFSKGRRVGIDIEPVRNEFSWNSLEPMVFSAREQAEFALFPSHEKTKAFLRGWTRKEACLKGCGGGLSLPLNRVDVPLGTIRNPAPVFAPTEEGVTRWWLYPIDSIYGCIAALAVEEEPVRSRTAWWPALPGYSGQWQSAAGLSANMAAHGFKAVPADVAPQSGEASWTA
jgi:4'-phosphopantetheinyl transferase